MGFNRRVMPKQWFIGCAGFHYKSWKGHFYPEKLPQTRWFDHYAEHFNTLELNVTFYRFPRLPMLENWYNKAPDDFKISAKVPRAITHFKRFNDTHRMMSDVYGTLRDGLKEKLGCVLFQLTPLLKYSEETLDKILNHIDPTFTNMLEPRHESWWNQHVYNKLAAHGVTFCGHSYPELPDEVIVNSNVAYYRFHGVPHLYHSPYTKAQLKRVANALLAHEHVDTFYIYFNNTDSGHAIANAQLLQQMVGLSTVKV